MLLYTWTKRVRIEKEMVGSGGLFGGYTAFNTWKKGKTKLINKRRSLYGFLRIIGRTFDFYFFFFFLT